ncbi:MAG: hypothetical protein JW725_04700 [Candidatus Babeliaceae bacterium]|nr:hypothetical protein [Candidatus Babeliaceae bacterium]
MGKIRRFFGFEATAKSSLEKKVDKEKVIERALGDNNQELFSALLDAGYFSSFLEKKEISNEDLKKELQNKKEKPLKLAAKMDELLAGKLLLTKQFFEYLARYGKASEKEAFLLWGDYAIRKYLCNGSDKYGALARFFSYISKNRIKPFVWPDDLSKRLRVNKNDEKPATEKSSRFLVEYGGLSSQLLNTDVYDYLNEAQKGLDSPYLKFIAAMHNFINDKDSKDKDSEASLMQVLADSSTKKISLERTKWALEFFLSDAGRNLLHSTSQKDPRKFLNMLYNGMNERNELSLLSQAAGMLIDAHPDCIENKTADAFLKSLFSKKVTFEMALSGLGIGIDFISYIPVYTDDSLLNLLDAAAYVNSAVLPYSIINQLVCNIAFRKDLNSQEIAARKKKVRYELMKLLVLENQDQICKDALKKIEDILWLLVRGWEWEIVGDSQDRRLERVKQSYLAAKFLGNKDFVKSLLNALYVPEDQWYGKISYEPKDKFDERKSEWVSIPPELIRIINSY